MKPSHHAESTQSAPTRYSPSVPMSVYRELAAELRANKAVIDSLNSRNQQLIEQNQRLKQEIHNVVQATLNLGQFAGVARQAAQEEFPSAIAPDTLAKLVRAQGEARKVIPSEPLEPQNYADTMPPLVQPSMTTAHPSQPVAQPPVPQQPIQQPGYPVARQPQVAPAPSPAPQPRRVPRPIQKGTPQAKSPERAPAARKQTAKPVTAKPATGKTTATKTAAKAPARQPVAARKASQRTEIVPQAKPLPKLFTEQAGEYRSSALSSDEEKEIGGIWLALSIILIIVTAFGAGFLIMKPLLNDR